MIGVFSAYHGLVNNSGDEAAAKIAQLTAAAVAAKPGCRCCRVVLSKHYRLIKIKREGKADSSNLLPVCPICYSLHNGGYAPDGERQGTMIYLPDISQVDLIRLFWVLAANQTLERGVSKQISRESLLALEALAEPVVLLANSSDPRVFANFLSEAVKDGVYEERKKALGGIRFLPNMDAFEEPLKTYMREAHLNNDLLANTDIAKLRG